MRIWISVVRHYVWLLFCSRWLWSLWRVPCKEAAGIQGPLNASFLLHPCFFHRTHGPAAPIASGMVSQQAPCQCIVSPRHLLNLSFFSTSKPVHQRQLLGSSCDEIHQRGPHGMSVREEGPCWERGRPISLRSCVCYSECHLLWLTECVPKRSFALRPSLTSPFPR